MQIVHVWRQASCLFTADWFLSHKTQVLYEFTEVRGVRTTWNNANALNQGINILGADKIAEPSGIKRNLHFITLAKLRKLRTFKWVVAFWQGKLYYQEIKPLERKAFAEGSSVCQIIVGQHWRFVICDWLDLICHMYLCPLAEHRGWGLPLACLCKRSKIYI